MRIQASEFTHMSPQSVLREVESILRNKLFAEPEQVQEEFGEGFKETTSGGTINRDEDAVDVAAAIQYHIKDVPLEQVASEFYPGESVSKVKGKLDRWVLEFGVGPQASIKTKEYIAKYLAGDKAEEVPDMSRAVVRRRRIASRLNLLKIIQATF